MGLVLMFLAGMSVALANLCLKKSIERGGGSKGFLMIQMLFSFFFALMVHPILKGIYVWDWSVGIAGLIGGLMLAGLTAAIGRAAELGPPGLTFAVFNASTVMPILLLVLLFGSHFGFHFTLWNGVGSLLVVVGIFWAGMQNRAQGGIAKWLLFCLAAFIFNVFYLVFLEWRVLFLHHPGDSKLLIPLTPVYPEAPWFMPIVFFVSGIVQAVIFWRAESRSPHKQEMVYGTVGGLLNGLATFLMIAATEVASSIEQPMLFPVFSVMIILGCNLWGQWLYRENVYWRAMACCIIGLLLGNMEMFFK